MKKGVFFWVCLPHFFSPTQQTPMKNDIKYILSPSFLKYTTAACTTVCCFTSLQAQSQIS